MQAKGGINFISTIPNSSLDLEGVHSRPTQWIVRTDLNRGQSEREVLD